MEQVAVAASTTKSIVLVFFGTSFTLAGIWLFWLGSDDSSYSPHALRLVGSALALVFGVVLFYGFKTFLDKTPALTISPMGLVDNSSGPISAGDIPWSQVERVTLTRNQFQKFITIFVRDPNRYLTHGNALRRIVFQSNLKTMGSPIAISANALNMDAVDVVKLIQDHLEKFRRG